MQVKKTETGILAEGCRNILLNRIWNQWNVQLNWNSNMEPYETTYGTVIQSYIVIHVKVKLGILLGATSASRLAPIGTVDQSVENLKR